VKLFQTDAPVAAYTSPVGNNDVPYPYAVDVDGVHYLLIEDAVVRDVPPGTDDPYRYYYDSREILELGAAPVTLDIDGVDVELSGFGVGDDAYTLTYVPYAAADYDESIRRLARNDGDTMWWVRDGIREDVTRDDYVALMRAVGAERGFGRLPARQVVDMPAE